MIEFCLKLDSNKVSRTSAYNLFLVGSVGLFRKCILNKLDKEVCKSKDNEIKASKYYSKITPDDLGDNFTYNLIIYMSKHLICYRDKSDIVWYTFDIPALSRYGSRYNVDLLLRLIEYGSDTIQPLMIFSSAFTEFNYKIKQQFYLIYK